MYAVRISSDAATDDAYQNAGRATRRRTAATDPTRTLHTVVSVVGIFLDITSHFWTGQFLKSVLEFASDSTQ